MEYSDQHPWSSRPARDVPDGLILFDGVCNLCSGWVRFVIRRDRAEFFRFLAIQTPTGRALAVRLLIDPDQPETNAVTLDGTVHFKSDAALAVISKLPRWGWTRVLERIPKRWRDTLYDQVAQNRYRVFGRSSTCMVPSPDVKRRFLDSGSL
jgi:predicted DCC family thiol-disulfide oxidoreductase YuxK